MDEARRLGVAGLCATAVTFGPARNGFGLFLPYFREEFDLSTTTLGLIASGLYAGYLIALSAVGLLATRIGPRPPVVIGVVSAGLGMGLVAVATNTVVLAAGVVLAGTGAGWTWAPFNDATEHVPTRTRNRVLSVVSTGTTFGILAAGVLALAMGANWRAAWTAFAVAAGGAVGSAVAHVTSRTSTISRSWGASASTSPSSSVTSRPERAAVCATRRTSPTWR